MMNRLQKIAIGCGAAVLGGVLLVGWALGAAPGRSPHDLIERMIGTALPKGVGPDVQFQGLLGPIPTDVEYIAQVSFVMSAQDLEAFATRLDCPLPAAENLASVQYECVLHHAQKPGGWPPERGTAESRVFQFRLRDDNTVFVQMQLMAT
jgi:hypothetical protein